MSYWKSILIAINIVTLTSCIPIVVGGATAATLSTTIIYDKRSWSTINQDHNISYNIKREITTNTALAKKSRIKVTTFNSKVLLVGCAKNATTRDQIEAIARDYPNVEYVYNEILIENPASIKTHVQANWINARIKSKLLAHHGFYATQIKITTYNGAVFLMGEITPEQAQWATEIARQIKGVTRVVVLFDYVDEDEHDELQ